MIGLLSIPLTVFAAADPVWYNLNWHTFKDESFGYPMTFSCESPQETNPNSYKKTFAEYERAFATVGCKLESKEVVGQNQVRLSVVANHEKTWIQLSSANCRPQAEKPCDSDQDLVKVPRLGSCPELTFCKEKKEISVLILPTKAKEVCTVRYSTSRDRTGYMSTIASNNCTNLRNGACPASHSLISIDGYIACKLVETSDSIEIPSEEGSGSASAR